MSFSEFYLFFCFNSFLERHALDCSTVASYYKPLSSYVVRTLSYVVKHLFLRPLLLAFFEKIQVFRYQSSIDTFLTQNINQNVLSRSIRNVKILFFLSVANTVIFKHCFFTSQLPNNTLIVIWTCSVHISTFDAVERVVLGCNR